MCRGDAVLETLESEHETACKSTSGQYTCACNAKILHACSDRLASHRLGSALRTRVPLSPRRQNRSASFRLHPDCPIPSRNHGMPCSTFIFLIKAQSDMSTWSLKLALRVSMLCREMSETTSSLSSKCRP